jgi:hypothetical protein
LRILALPRKHPFQPHVAVAQHGGVKSSLDRRRHGAGKDPLEQRPVEGDQQQIDTGIERFDHRRTDIALIDRPHHEVVGHDDALIIPLLANDAVDDRFGMRRRAVRIY